ncbi:RsmB/NOP family class I SAM-dependent RNA methyltransferase [Leucobacter tenebrionis]|uniref:RsmB/NOP family class I SAM-dependent RNA methyltransferase n=1 Tax=Leucobacter tenebrionis TaxID=2873270 RepID=UPI001CA6FF0B|nr:transcription antitermination factor NusB [Leucobacter tenebrionis]QZY51906.1 rRNA small subunit methyltransferase B [Leucobacter tenebrionis]
MNANGTQGPRRGPRSGSRDHHRRGQQRHTPPARVSPARMVAYDVLRDVDDRDAYANLALSARIREARLDGRDAALATELASGALRWRGRYDRIVELAADRDAERIDSRTLNVLRLGAHQLLSMRTADHAAVNESVELQRRVGNRAAAGFVNGVLRAIGRASNAEWDERITAASRSEDDALAATTSHPAWVLRALRDALRAEGRQHELDDLLAADNASPRVSLALLPGADIDAETAEALSIDTRREEAALTASGPSPLGLELTGGDPARAIDSLDLPAGVVRVQDQGSQLAALALSRAREPRAGERWLDLCAGPGGKTAVLAAEAALSGAGLRANEVSEHRAELVRRSVEAHADEVEIVSHDGRDDAAYGGSDARFDRILVDAPCSGLGALRRRPEARWRKRPSDLPELTSLQAELLDAAVAHLAEGGLLAYVTCSPHLAETRVVVDRLLRRHSELRELDAGTVLGRVVRAPLDLAGERLSAQLWPHRHGTDAMFVSLFERGS